MNVAPGGLLPWSSNLCHLTPTSTVNLSAWRIRVSWNILPEVWPSKQQCTHSSSVRWHTSVHVGLLCRCKLKLFPVVLRGVKQFVSCCNFVFYCNLENTELCLIFWISLLLLLRCKTNSSILVSGFIRRGQAVESDTLETLIIFTQVWQSESLWQCNVVQIHIPLKNRTVLTSECGAKESDVSIRLQLRVVIKMTNLAHWVKKSRRERKKVL